MKVSSNGVLITPTIQKYLNIIESGKIEEGELISMKSLVNSNKDAKDLIFDAFYKRMQNEGEGVKLSDKQNKKGIDFLLNLWKTPRGIERKNSPFGYREENILQNFSHFTVEQFYDAGNYHNSYYIPLFVCHAKDGNSFEYYYNGKVNITG